MASSARSALIGEVAARIAKTPRHPVPLIAIDGVDGSGKTHFADELAPAVEALGRPVIRASVDGFHHPRAVRYRLGRLSPRGYFMDSFDYPSLRSVLLDPLRTGAARVRTAAFDHPTDMPITEGWREVPPSAVLILDGVFLHRDELRALWAWSVFLDVPFSESVARMAVRDGAPPDPDDPANRRYVEGQKLYLDQCRPAGRASLVIDNADLAVPRIIGGHDRSGIRA